VGEGAQRGRRAQSCYVDEAPSFGRGPFSHDVCTSVKDTVLHGRPYDYPLADGDLVSLDLAVTTAGIAADSAISFIVDGARTAADVAMIEPRTPASPPRDRRPRR
jgi:methionyl aminopeptidase